MSNYRRLDHEENVDFRIESIGEDGWVYNMYMSILSE